jgi:hypothetical protein
MVGHFIHHHRPQVAKVTGCKFQAAALVGAGQLMNPAVVFLLHLFEEKVDVWLETTTQKTGVKQKSL